MAKITVVASPFANFLLWDLDKVQQLREHTINPPGQERYISPIDVEALRTQLEVLAGGAVTTAEALNVIDATVGADDVSEATIATAAVAAVAELIAGEIATSEQRQSIQSLITYSFVETGNFQLSYNGGVLAKMLELGWIKVFTEAGDALYTL